MESLSFHRDSIRPLTLHSGFTLIELLVVIAIMITIMGIVLTNQSSFNKTLILENTAYDVALTLRSAQAYGIGSRVAGSSVANAGYGIDLQSVSSGSFALFADTNLPNASNCHGLPVGGAGAPDALPGNCVYDAGEPLVQTYVLGNGITISDFCARVSNSWSCAHASGGGLSSLDIVFARPNPTPFMSKNNSYSAAFPITAACFVISSSQGSSRFVSIAASGEITANAPSCP